MPEVPAKNTPASGAELRQALVTADPSLSPNTQALLLAHIAIETRNGQSIKQHNVGNLTVGRKSEPSVLFWRPPWFNPPGPDASERTRRLHALMLEGKAPRAFRAYLGLSEGVSDYLERLGKRFPSMLAARTPDDFVQAWRDSGYTPDLDVERTTPNFTALWSKFGGGTAGAPLGPSGGRGVGGLIAGGALIGGGLWWLKKRKSG